MGGELAICGFFIEHLGHHNERYLMVFLSLSLQIKGSTLN